MKTSRWMSCMALVVLGIFLTGFVVMAQQKAPDTVTIMEFPKASKPAVIFPHHKHSVDIKIACNQCHHRYQDGKNVWKDADPAEKCAKCHTEMTTEGEKKLPPEQQKLNLKLAFHTLCQGCHQKTKKENPAANPALTCAACHSAEKK